MLIAFAPLENHKIVKLGTLCIFFFAFSILIMKTTYIVPKKKKYSSYTKGDHKKMNSSLYPRLLSLLLNIKSSFSLLPENFSIRTHKSSCEGIVLLCTVHASFSLYNVSWRSCHFSTGNFTSVFWIAVWYATQQDCCLIFSLILSWYVFKLFPIVYYYKQGCNPSSYLHLCKYVRIFL